MNYYSHAKKEESSARVGSKLLIDHIDGVRTKALAAFFETAGLPVEAEKVKLLLSEICLYHDLGKYTTHFQNYLLDKTGEFDLELKQHARFGAFVLLNKLLPQWEEGALLAWYIIVHHHSSLWDFRQLSDMLSHDRTDHWVFDHQMPSFLAALETVKSEFKEPELQQWLRFPTKEAGKKLRQFLKREVGIHHYFLTNLLFSLLIESDKLDASDSRPYSRKTPPSNLVDLNMPMNLPQGFDKMPLAEFDQNQLRSYVRWQVNRHFENQEELLGYRLFTLTAPTGIGKTLTALDFALKLKSLIREREHREVQIIYGLPFINIIEQAIPVYEEVLSNYADVLPHYQFADALEFVKKSEREPANENLNYNQRQMLLDTWQSDVVVTTFVQLLHTIIGYRNKVLLKFHHLAGSIIILDEIQAIKLEHLPLVGASLHYLGKFLDARILVMTATRPKIYELAEKEILREKNEAILPQKELLTGYAAVFQIFRRTKIVPVIAHPLEDEAAFWTSVFEPNWSIDKSCLVVVNTVKRSLEVFDYFTKKWKAENLDNPLHYLSTNIVPAHRMNIIRQVKNDLENGFCPILISTQSVEAGVDLSFDMAFRDLAPIDSIIQVAGRVNRHNKKGLEHSPVYVMDFGDCERIYGKITTPQAKKALVNELIQFPEGIGEENYFSLIEGYFDDVACRSSFQDSREIFKAMQCLKYDGTPENKKNGEVYVSSFKVIEDKGFAASVFIECDDEATKALEKFRELGKSKMGKFERKEAFEPFKKAFHQHIITVPKYLPKMEELQKEEPLIEDTIWLVKQERIKEYYDLTTGFIRLDDTSPESHSLMF